MEQFRAAEEACVAQARHHAVDARGAAAGHRAIRRCEPAAQQNQLTIPARGTGANGKTDCVRRCVAAGHSSRGQQPGQRGEGDARARRAATSSSTRNSARRRSPRTASPSPRKSSCKDPLENMGAQMVSEVASKTSDVAGDGTTTATVLAQAIYREGAKNVTAGANPMAIKRGIDKAVEAIVADAQDAVEAGDGRDDRAGRHHLGQPRRDDRPDHRRSDGEGRQGRRHHRRGGARRSRPRSRSSRACSSTAATCRRTSSPIPSAWKSCSRTRSS